jgi:hypothetical protein
MEITLPDTPQPVPRGQGKLLLLFLIAFLPLVAAAVMYFGKIGLPVATTNYGSLVVPPLTEADHGILIGAPEVAPAAALQIDGNRRWLVLVVAGVSGEATGGTCGDDCQQALYLVRQVNVALGKDAGRVGRVLLATEEFVETRADDMLIYRTFSAEDHAALDQALAATKHRLQPWDVLIMDPLGNIMMQYSGELSGKEILEDFKRLLKVSKIG